jgi:hypothetical protein
MKSPNPSSVGAALKRAGFKRHYNRPARGTANAGFKTAKLAQGRVLVSFRGGSDTDTMGAEEYEETRTRMLGYYAEALRSAGYAISASGTTLTVTAQPALCVDETAWYRRDLTCYETATKPQQRSRVLVHGRHVEGEVRKFLAGNVYEAVTQPSPDIITLTGTVPSELGGQRDRLLVLAYVAEYPGGTARS